MPESATEWIASASIEEYRVRKNAMNFVMAMPTLANSAATTALVPPSLPSALLPVRGSCPVSTGPRDRPRPGSNQRTGPTSRYAAA